MKRFLPLCVAVLCLSFAGCPEPPAAINDDDNGPVRTRIPVGGFTTIGFEVDAVPAFVLPVPALSEESPAAEE